MRPLRDIVESAPFTWITLGICGLYCCLFAVQYLSDPLALSPQLDAKENLTLAEQIDQGTLSEEPIYRAMLYPAALSLLPQGQERISTGLLLGLVCHLLNGYLVYLLSGYVWKKRSSATVAAALYLLNPASLFFAMQLLDVTLAITLYMSGMIIALGSRETVIRPIFSGLLIGMAALARPHFLPVALMSPVLLSLWPQRRLRINALAWIPLAALFLLQGAFNYQHGGEFRILPWQGSYNLWAANRAGANGLYFEQSLDMSARGTDSNPARAESVALFGMAHPALQPPYPITQMNRYWNKRFLDRLADDPASLVKLCLFKAYATINSYEQYNNLTVAFHKARLPWLRYNPMNWGLLFVAAAVGAVLLWQQGNQRLLVLLLWICLYGTTLLMYYASARFRLPLVPVMAVLAGGFPFYNESLSRFPGKLTGVLSVILIAGTVTYSSIFGIHSTSTFVQDELLLANANADLGRDMDAARLSRQVLEKVPGRAEALRIYTISYFNLRLLEQDIKRELGDWEAQRTWVIQSPPTDTTQDAILGIFYWKWGERESAIELWKQISPLGMNGSPMATICLEIADGNDSLQGQNSDLGKALKAIMLPPENPSEP